MTIKRKLIITTEFHRAYISRIRPNQRLNQSFHEARLSLETEEEGSLLNHPLQGSMLGDYAYEVEDDCRIIFRPTKKGILLLDIGIHDEVYRD